MIPAEIIFMLALLSLALGVFAVSSLVKAKQNNPNAIPLTDFQNHLFNAAGSWVGILTILFGAYWLGEVATALLIIFIGAKGLHEIISLYKAQPTKLKETTKPLTFWFIAALLFMVICWLILNHLLTEQHQRAYMLFMLFVVQFNDVNQFFMGNLFGHKLFKQKLAPSLSPNKTIEGAIFGVLLTSAMAMPIGIALTNFNPLGCFIMSLLLGGFGIMGDLYQSTFKRTYNIKDMGSWIKGHGGIMDRVDSLLFAIPIFLWIFGCAFLTN